MMNEVTNKARNSCPQSDRRQDSRRSFFYSLYKRRRRQARRDYDKSNNIYVDVHEPYLFVLCASIIILSVTDASLTLFIINNGGEEVNPFMRYFLESSVSTFFWVKYLLTSFSILFLISHKHFTLFKVIRGYHLIYVTFFMYVCLIMYELFLIFQIYEMR